MVFRKLGSAVAGSVLLLATLAARGSGPAPSGVTPTPAPPGLPAAMARMQAGDPAGAVAILEPLTRRDPDNPHGWGALGAARIKTKDLDGAAAASTRALELEPGSTRAMYNLGVV